MKRDYFSVRTGRNKNFHNFSLDILQRLFKDLYEQLDNEGYFQEFLGSFCVDGYLEGKLGNDKSIQAIIYRKLRKDLWPLADTLTGFNRIMLFKEDDLFDLMEFLYDCVSKPLSGNFHEWNNCGWHYDKFDKKEGQVRYAKEINEILSGYGDGYEMDGDGQLTLKGEYGLKKILNSKLPSTADKNTTAKINFAVGKYLGSRSDLDERKVAVRELADILESLRKEIKSNMLSKDDATLFQIANKFYIRHSDEGQIKNYDKTIWYSWMFYFYLSTIYALLKLIEKNRDK